MEDSEAYIRYPEHRRWFDKLHLSETLGYDCGPCGVAPSKDGYYIVRPIYNLSGMSIGAKKAWIEKGDVTKVPPGYFWCEWFDGRHFSVSFTHSEGWKFSSAWEGFKNDANLSRFTKWVRLGDFSYVLPATFDVLSNIGIINVEFIGEKIIEVHLRDTPDPDYDELIPIWADNEKELDFYTKSGYSILYQHDNGDGFLDTPRIGFAVKNH
jgi:hypothetical protein